MPETGFSYWNYLVPRTVPIYGTANSVVATGHAIDKTGHATDKRLYNSVIQPLLWFSILNFSLDRIVFFDFTLYTRIGTRHVIMRYQCFLVFTSTSENRTSFPQDKFTETDDMSRGEKLIVGYNVHLLCQSMFTRCVNQVNSEEDDWSLCTAFQTSLQSIGMNQGSERPDHDKEL